MGKWNMGRKREKCVADRVETKVLRLKKVIKKKETKS